MVHMCEEDHESLVLAVAHTCADFLYVWASCQIQNLVVIFNDKRLACM